VGGYESKRSMRADGEVTIFLKQKKKKTAVVWLELG
jgi:hypothetical protein